MNFEPVAPDEVGELGSALDVEDAEESFAASSNTSFAPNVNTPVAPAKSETSSDGLLSSSMMLKKISGGCSEPGSRNCFQFISAKVIREQLKRIPVSMEQLKCIRGIHGAAKTYSGIHGAAKNVFRCHRSREHYLVWGSGSPERTGFLFSC